MEPLKSFEFSCSSFSPGHPDKLADQISDAILDEYLQSDPCADVSCDTIINRKGIIITGNICSRIQVSWNRIEQIVRQVMADEGYTDEKHGYDSNKIEVINYLDVCKKGSCKDMLEFAGKKQCLIVGYACDETDAYLPLPLYLANKIIERIDITRKDGSIPWLLPNAVAQVTVSYGDNIPVHIPEIILSVQHMPLLNKKTFNDNYDRINSIPKTFGKSVVIIKDEFIYSVINDMIVNPIIEKHVRSLYPICRINHLGKNPMDEPLSYTGITGRKIVAGTYGGFCPQGSSTLSGKDPGKFERSGAYAMRYIAKHVVAAGLAKRCTVMATFSFGNTCPTSIIVNLHGTGKVTEYHLLGEIYRLFGFSFNQLFNRVSPRKPIYRKSSVFGHFGNECYPWENLDKDFINRLKTCAPLNEKIYLN